MSARGAGAVLEELREAKLREIGPRVERLGAAQARAVEREARRQLEEAVSRRALSPEHRWLITALQFLPPGEAGGVLTEALRQAVNLKGCCGCTLNRTMRALGAVRPVAAIPALVDVICEAEHPRHKHLAAVCIEKVVKARGAGAEAILSGEASRLRAALDRIEEEVATTKGVTPQRAWDDPPGSPGWRAAAGRAMRGIERLL